MIFVLTKTILVNK